MDGAFISYLRVSTDRQGKSGLGLEAQRAAVAAYLNGGDWRIIKEFVEVESGRQSERPVLAQALTACRLYRAPLVVAKVDRLTRSLAFLTRLLEAEIDVRFCDLPQIEGPTGRFMIQQMASVAELEAGMISKRTKDALKAAKARGTKLGGVRVSEATKQPTIITPEAAAKGVAARQKAADARADDLAPVIAELRSEGHVSLGAIAKALTDRGIPTARGNSQWSPMQVARIVKRHAADARN
ncbi:MAG: recombinase family protein [Rhodoblastus sp.]|nr:recombinase family protein [Rhodoblastus sp.]